MKADDLKVGDRIADNDPRMTGRVLVIAEIRPYGVVARSVGGGRHHEILKRRIHFDGKPRKSGFSFVEQAA